MAAGDRIFSCRAVTKNATPIDGATHASFGVTTARFTDPGGAGAPGPVEHQVGKQSIRVSVFGINLNVLLALIGSTAEDIIIGTKGVAGANEKITLTGVAFTDLLGDVEIPRDDAGRAIAPYGIAGECEWGAEDTLATMILAEADT